MARSSRHLADPLGTPSFFWRWWPTWTWLSVLILGSATVVAGPVSWPVANPFGTSFQQRPLIDGWRWVNETALNEGGAAQLLGLSPNRTDTLALIFELMLDGRVLTGRLGVSEVRLENVDGVWSGRFGAQFVSEAKVVSVETDLVTVEVTSVGTSGPTLAEPARSDGPSRGVPGATFNTSPRMASGGPASTFNPTLRNALTGRRRFPILTVEDGSREARMTGGQSEIDGAVTLSSDGTRLQLSTHDELVSDDGTVYRGRLQPRYRVARQLEAYGALSPSRVIHEDPVLYVLLYRFALELEAFFPE